ncbi:MAG: Fic family protein, partial [Deltaproteobacteria bacterium]|nr:Fic family protein [Deltaproteobacteria bacterium]
MPEQISYKWYPIEDYTDDPQTLSKTELEQLSSVWLEQKRALEDTEGLKTFNQRLHREWAIETGLLERIYTLDRGVTQILIERGIDASLIPHQSTGQDPTRIVAIIKDHEAALEGLFAFVKGDRRLSTSYIKELHALLTRNQKTTTAIDQFGRSVEIPLLHGDYKKQPNNPRRPDGSLHQYGPPEQVASEMDRLIERHLRHGNVPPEVEAAWLHHRFTQIHPFQDGNGRVARCL